MQSTNISEAKKDFNTLSSSDFPPKNKRVTTYQEVYL